MIQTEDFENLVENNWCTNMTDTDAHSQMKNDFVFYKSLLRKHSLFLVNMDNKKVAA